MKVIWLNDSLVLRAESREEKQALAVVFNALEPKETADKISNHEEGSQRRLNAIQSVD